MPRTADAEAAWCLTTADRIALATWHGGRRGSFTRTVLEGGTPGASPDRGGYILVYRDGDGWATFGLARGCAGVLVWRCSNGAVLGTYPTMTVALAALPHAMSRR